MIDPTNNRPKGGEAMVSVAQFRWIQYGVLGTVCALVVGAYAYAAQSGSLESMTPNAADTYYNLLVQGFRAGQLKPDDAGTHYNFGVALEQAGRVQDAIGHYEQALRIMPDFTEARTGLARLRTVQ